MVVNRVVLVVCLVGISSNLAQSVSTNYVQPERYWTQNQELVFRDERVRPQEVLIKFRTTLSIERVQNIVKVLPNVDVVERIGGVPNLYRIHSRTSSVRNLLERLEAFDQQILYK